MWEEIADMISACICLFVVLAIVLLCVNNCQKEEPEQTFIDPYPDLKQMFIDDKKRELERWGR